MKHSVGACWASRCVGWWQQSRRSSAAAIAARIPLDKSASASSAARSTADGSSTVGPYTTAAAELFRKAGAKKVQHHCRHLGHRWRLRALLPRRDRPLGRFASDEGSARRKCKTTNIGWLARVHRRQRRTHGRRQQGEHVGDMPHGRRAEEDLGTRLEGQQLEGRPRVVPGRVAQALRSRHGLGHVRLLHRGDQRQGQGVALGLLGRPRTTTCSSRASPVRRVAWGTSATRTSRRTRTS